MSSIIYSHILRSFQCSAKDAFFVHFILFKYKEIENFNCLTYY